MIEAVSKFGLRDAASAKLISSVHVVGRESRQIKEVLRQRCFFVRQRTMLRNRIHRLLGGQQEVKLPQCSDLFGRKGLSLLEKLELPAPARLLLTQQLALLKELAVRIREDEETLEELLQENPALNYEPHLPLEARTSFHKTGRLAACRYLRSADAVRPGFVARRHQTILSRRL